jgi:hypothetical protein
MLVNDAENSKIKIKITRTTRVIKFSKIFKRQEPEVLISKINRGRDVIKTIK